MQGNFLRLRHLLSWGSGIAATSAEQKSGGNKCAQPANGISKASQAGSLIVIGSGVTDSASLGGRDAPSSGNDQLPVDSALTHPLPMRNLRAIQPLDRSISDDAGVETAQTWPEDGRPKSQKIRFQMIANNQDLGRRKGEANRSQNRICHSDHLRCPMPDP